VGSLFDKVFETVLNYGYAGIFAVLAFEGTGMPAPVQIVFIATALLIKKGRMSFEKAIITIAFGNLLGNIIAYYAGRIKGKPFFDKYGQKIKLWREGFDLIREWYAKWGGWVIIFSRLIGLPRTPVIWASGVIGVNLIIYVIYSFIADLIWAAFYTLLAYKGVSLLPYVRKLILKVFF